MRDFSCDLRIPLVVLALPLAAGAGQAGQTPAGQPDLQGLWTNSTTTPPERPTAMADRAVLTDEEVAALDAQAVGRNDRPPRPGGDLFVARWESGPPVLAVHGITGSHVAWPWVADRLAGAVSLIAPDLRGRRPHSGGRALAVRGESPASHRDPRRQRRVRPVQGATREHTGSIRPL